MTNKPRRFETLCPVCHELVGVRMNNYNATRFPDGQSTTRQAKIVRHHNPAKKWCKGQGLAVPQSQVVPRD